MKSLFRWYVYTHVHTALAAVALYALYMWGISAPFDRRYALFLGASTFAYYNFLHLLHLPDLRPCVQQRLRRRAGWVGVSAWVAALVGLTAWWRSPYRSLWYAFVFPAVLALLYHNRPARALWPGLRPKGVFKVLSVPLVWAALAAGIPALATMDLPRAAFVFVHAFLFVLLWTVPFDMRDLALDKESMLTLPRIFKEKIFLAVVPLWLVYAVLTLMVFRPYKESILLFEIGGLLLLGAVAAASRCNRRYFFTAFWVEGIPIWLWAAYFLWKAAGRPDL